MSVWICLHYVLKTNQLYQAMNLLKEYHITLRTLPDEFNGIRGSERLMSMDADIMWPLYVKRNQLTQAISILSEAHLIPIQHNTLK